MVSYKEVEAGHKTFLIGKEMSYLDDVFDLLKQYHLGEAQAFLQ